MKTEVDNEAKHLSKKFQRNGILYIAKSPDINKFEYAFQLLKTKAGREREAVTKGGSSESLAEPRKGGNSI